MITRFRVLGGMSDAPLVLRLLVLAQLAFNVGFYMVVPYLAVHLTDSLGLGAGVVGLVLGLRTFSQQGLFVIGGALADRWGAKPVIVTGCAVRVLGFVVLGGAGDLVGALAGAALTGFAAALFSPAVESTLARESQVAEAGPTRAEAFAIFAVAGQVGSVIGPVVGTALLLVDFSLACWVAAAAFVVIGLAHARLLPASPAAHAGEPLFGGWADVLRNRRFLAFAAGYSGYLLCYNQLYLALPVELVRETGSQSALGWLFVVASVMVIIGQLPITRWARRLGAGPAVAVGFAATASAFGVVAAAVAADLGGPGPAIAMVVLLTAGQMIAIPMAQDLVPRLAGERHLGAYFGVLSSVGGLAVLVGSSAVGILLDPAVAPPVVPWLALTAVPVAGVLVITLLHRRGALSG